MEYLNGIIKYFLIGMDYLSQDFASLWVTPTSILRAMTCVFRFVVRKGRGKNNEFSNESWR